MMTAWTYPAHQALLLVSWLHSSKHLLFKSSAGARGSSGVVFNVFCNYLLFLSGGMVEVGTG